MKQSDHFGWDQLDCRYFSDVCIKELGPFFTSQGFSAETTVAEGVVFRKGEIYVEISYIPESAPKYSPTLIIGIGKAKFDDEGNPTGVPAWSFISENSENLNYTFWRFSSEKELADVFNRLKGKVIEVFLQSLWEDKPRLQKAVNSFVGSLPT